MKPSCRRRGAPPFSTIGNPSPPPPATPTRCAARGPPALAASLRRDMTTKVPVIDLATILLTTALGTLAAQLLLWAASLRLRDASIVDIYWGPGLAQIAILTA